MKKFSTLHSTRIIIIIVSILLCSNAFAQQPAQISKVNFEPPTTAHLKMISASNNLNIAKEGTYQIIRVTGKEEEVVIRCGCGRVMLHGAGI